MKKTISAIIITRNEAHNLHDCLQSLHGWTDEIIVVDSASTDATVDIAKGFGAKVHITAQWPGFGAQKNKALNLATSDWVFSIDADERVPAELAHEIVQITQSDNSRDGYEMPRSSWYCGRFMKHSGWYPDYVLRLFKRTSGRFSQDLIHERVIVQGVTGRLTHALLHYSFRNFSQVLDKIDRYSTASAQQLYERGKKSSLPKAVGHGLWAFVRTYFLKAGFLDGAHGFALAVSNAHGTYYRYLKLWLIIQENQTCQKNH
jgi:glycosyltransferase involved in cell wall biosynthesis